MSKALLDILVEDAQGVPALAVECRAIGARGEAEHELAGYIRSVGGVPFAMLVDPQEIRIFRTTPDGLSPVLTLSTPAVFRHYEPRFGSARVYEHTLVTLCGAWLRDVMDHWRGPPPPGEDELRRVGLLPRILGGWTRTEVRVRAAPVS